MMLRIIMAVIALLLCTHPALAAPIRISVAEFKVTGGGAKDELKGALQSMLASRLAGDRIEVVGANEAPELTVIGTYIVFGKVFSLDGQLVGSNGKVVGRAFEQGETADDVIPAIGRLAQKLSGEIAKVAPAAADQPNVAVAPVQVAPRAAVPVVPAGSPDIVRGVPAAPAPKEGDVIRPEKLAKSGESGMIGQRLDGVMIGLVQLKRIDRDSRDLVVALEGELRLYRQEKGLRLIEVEKNFASSDKIISIDCADLDGDKIPELYVTMLSGESLASRVYLVENGKFKQIASNLSYYFRGFSPKGAGQKIYAQTMGIDEDFYGDMYEVVKKGSSFETINPMKLPRFGNLYNVNLFADKDGNTLFVLLHPDGFLTVSDDKGENVWKSSDKYGGSEMYFTRDDMQNIRVTGSQFRKRFIEQRITVTSAGEVIVPKNEGSFVVGNSRSFSKSSVYAFTWNGAALDELWHTKLDQNYLSDYFYDSEHKELVMLEVVKKAGVTEKGASAVFVKRVE